MEIDKPCLTEFVATPHLMYAASVLRAAIPHQDGFAPGSESLTVIRDREDNLSAETARIINDSNGVQECKEFTLSEWQAEAATVLLVTISYHYALLEEGYEPPSDDDAIAFIAAARANLAPPDGRLAAQESLDQSIEKTIGLVVGTHGFAEHSFTIYR
ncbi:MAG TPA: hypothetical protein VFZ58_04460 [Candidatus Saccharimonadales bacterium]